MKRRVATAAPPAPPPDRRRPRPARQQLRDFAAFIEAQDPEALAREVTMIVDTLKHCATIQSFFQRYVEALKARVVH